MCALQVLAATTAVFLLAGLVTVAFEQVDLFHGAPLALHHCNIFRYPFNAQYFMTSLIILFFDNILLNGFILFHIVFNLFER